MIIDYWLLPVALVLLWLPRHWLRLGQPSDDARAKAHAKSSRRTPPRTEGEVQESSAKLKEEFHKPRNWVDFFRAMVGGIAIGLVCFQPDAGESLAGSRRLIFISQCVVLIIAVVIQTVRHGGRLTLFAPVFFILGLSFGLIGWQAALFAFITIWVLELVLPGPGVMLLCYTGLVLFYGLLLPHPSTALVCLAAGLASLPVLLSATTKRRFTQLKKKPKLSAA